MSIRKKAIRNINLHSRIGAFDSRRFGIRPKFHKKEELKKVEQKTILISKENEKILHKPINTLPSDVNDYHKEEKKDILFIMRHYLKTNPLNWERVEKIMAEYAPNHYFLYILLFKNGRSKKVCHFL